ncbi:MBL fold metallo-hydrolase [Pseudomonas sp. SWRI153]|uniref:MBL fold metallo-hydrolase n=1 Tax=Pseudomonas khorasanensis TaxID=2745508 RepID=A0A923JDV8_9PSED|nr:MBL fold metallo-hydrolase [Pseudomonas khorasanensis]MBV4484782.1 MBL fold metallo-hydrolase [Pseudomonas khorasanensis]
MRIHHLNCGCMCPFGGRLFDGNSHGLFAHLVCHCWLIETERDGLVLVDTGFGSADVESPDRIASFFRKLNNIKFEHALTAVSKVRALGFAPSDVRHIVLTHLDFDHAGGLSDFPDATVHVMQSEYRAAKVLEGWRATRRYRETQWQRRLDWQFYEPLGEQWKGFSGVMPVRGLHEEILMVPLPGHSSGHAGIAVPSQGQWKLHAGDAYFHHDEVHKPRRHCPPGLRFYQRMMDEDHAVRVNTQNRLRALALTEPDQVQIICSHDAAELRGVQSMSSRQYAAS